MLNKYWNLILHITITVFFLIFFAYLAYTFKPTPLSDFQQYYWDSFDNLSIYVKGGLLFLLYLPFKAIGIEPYYSALIVNSFCYILLSYLLYINYKSKWQLVATCTLPFFGLWFAGYSSSVNSDIPTIVFFLLGLKLLLTSYKESSILFFVFSILVTSFSLTMRSQLLYIYLVVLLIFIIYVLITKQHLKSFRKLISYLFICLFFSFSICSFLEFQSENKEEISKHKRLAFYTGLIQTNIAGPYCGEWTQEAVTRERSEREIPLYKAVLTGIKETPKKKLLTTMLCKWDNYLFNHNQNGFWWLQYQSTNHKDSPYFFLIFDTLEGISIKLIKILSLLLVFLFGYTFKTKTRLEKIVFILGILVLCLFFAIHSILEIQPRYMIPPITFITILLLYLQTGKIKDIAIGK